MKLTSKLLGGAGAALLVSAFAMPAQAQTTALYSGGGTLAEKVYRDIFNCYGNNAGGDTQVNLAGPATGCNTVTPYRSNVEPLYVGVGSGNGKSAFVNHDSTKFITSAAPDNPPVPSTQDFGPFYGTGTGAGWVKAASSANHFPNVHFVGSDDPLTAADIATYKTKSGWNDASPLSGSWGAPIQVPALISTMTVAFSPAATWTPNPKIKIPTGGSSNIQLSSKSLCGIFTGQITNWNDASITADNKGVPLGAGAITVFYRNSGSGSTFLLTNALVNQCSHTAYPVPASWQTAVNGSAHNTAGSGDNSWFINVAGAGLLPANFTGVSGSGGMKTSINGSTGGIGYLSPDFAKPIDSTGPATANLQTYASLLAGTAPVYKAPSAKNGTAIMGGAFAKSPLATANSCPVGVNAGQAADGICSHNPLNWGVTNPTPTSPAAYPIGGFTFIDTYTCFASATDKDALAGKVASSLGLLSWYFGSPTQNATHVKTELTANGFSAIPGGWLSGVKKLLLTDQKTAIGTPGQAKTGCVGVAGGA